MEWRKKTIRVVAILGTGYITACLLLLLIEKRMLFPVPKPSYDQSLEHLHYTTDQQGREVIMRFRLMPNSKGVVIYAHGNATDIGRVGGRIEYYERLGWSVCALEFPGYGISTEALDPEACYHAFDAAVVFIRERAGALPLVFHGRSLGSGVAAYAAEQHECAGLILESAYRSAQRVLLPIRIFPWDYFDTQARIQNINQPVVCIHGEADQVIDVSHGIYLSKHVPHLHAACWLPNTGHNDLRLSDHRVHKVLSEFLASLSLASTVEGH